VLVMSPVVERVYFALLLVPLALVRPVFGPAWMQVIALWVIALLPTGARHTVVEDGRILKSFGFLPTVPQLVIALAFLASMIALTAGPPRIWSSRRGGYLRAHGPPQRPTMASGDARP
jgi:hypothetical protein